MRAYLEKGDRIQVHFHKEKVVDDYASPGQLVDLCIVWAYLDAVCFEKGDQAQLCKDNRSRQWQEAWCILAYVIVFVPLSSQSTHQARRPSPLDWCWH